MGITDTLTERTLRARIEELEAACQIRDDTLDDREAEIARLREAAWDVIRHRQPHGTRRLADALDDLRAALEEE